MSFFLFHNKVQFVRRLIKSFSKQLFLPFLFSFIHSSNSQEMTLALFLAVLVRWFWPSCWVSVGQTRLAGKACAMLPRAICGRSLRFTIGIGADALICLMTTATGCGLKSITAWVSWIRPWQSANHSGQPDIRSDCAERRGGLNSPTRCNTHITCSLGVYTGKLLTEIKRVWKSLAP